MSFFKRLLKKTQKLGGKLSQKVGDITQEAVAGVTGSESLGEIAGGSSQFMTGGGSLDGLKRAGSGALGLGGEILGGGDSGEIQKETSALAQGNMEELKKKKRESLQASAQANSPGVRQQSVLTAR